MSGDPAGGSLKADEPLLKRLLQGRWRPLIVTGGLVLFALLLGVCLPNDNHNATTYGASEAEEQTPELTDEQRKAATDKALASYTFWLMVFTGVLAVSTVGLWIVTWRGVRRQAGDMKESIRHAEAAANAARDSTDVGRQALISANRAFVFVDHHDLHRISGSGPKRPFFFVTLWKNAGNSWTVRARNRINWFAIDTPLPDTFDFGDFGEDDQLVQLLIGPNGTAWGPRLPIPFETVVEALEGRLFLYAYGWCEYNDIFNNTPRHRTEFCVRIEPLAQPETDPAVAGDGKQGRRVTGHFSLHWTHNGADTDCLKPVQT